MNWVKTNKTKADKLLEKVREDLGVLHDKLFKLNYLAHSNNDPSLTSKIGELQVLLHQMNAVIRG